MNITQLTEKYIQEHPSIKDCVRKGLINYSALTRKISKDMKLDLDKNFDAILIACRRYFGKVNREAVMEEKILDLLKKSKVEVKNKMIAVIVEKNIYIDHLLDLEKEVKKKADVFHIIEGSASITIITGEEYLQKIKKLFKTKIIKENKNLVEIIVKSPSELETLPGVVGYLYSLFGENGINIIETMSTWTDTLFVIEEKDIAKVMQILRF